MAEATLKAYEPTWRDHLAQLLMGDDKASPEKQRLIGGLLGSTGLGNSGMSLSDLTPLGGVLGLQEAAKDGDKTGMVLNAAGLMLPGASPAAKALGLAEKEAAPAAEKFIRAYHGSPHDFDKFDLAKIGTGEGAQAYGHGLYFAENEGVAKSYRDALRGSGVEVFKDGQNLGRIPSGQVVNDPEFVKAYQNLIPADVPDWIKSGVLRDIRRLDDAAGPIDMNAARAASVERMTKEAAGMSPSVQQRMIDGVHAAYDSIGPSVEFRSPGRMYEVALKADPDHMLDWDKGIAQQSPAVQDAYAKARGWTPEQLAKFIDADPGRSGSALYTDMSLAAPNAAGRRQQAATDALRDAGIPGIKYLDQGSRGAGEGSRNYVAFDPSMIEILRKYGLAGLSLGGLGGLGGIADASQPAADPAL